jgi:hypothetical protein
MSLSATIVLYLFVYAPWLTLCGVFAWMGYKGLKGGSGGMHPVAAGIGETFCVMGIVVVPFIVLFLMVLLGLSGSMLFGWSIALLSLSGCLHDERKSMFLYLPLGALAAAMFVCALLWSMPYPMWEPPAWFGAIQRLPVLPFLSSR